MHTFAELDREQLNTFIATDEYNSLMALHDKLLNKNLVLLFTSIGLCILGGFSLGSAYVIHALEEHPIHELDPAAKYVWIGDLLARNQWVEVTVTITIAQSHSRSEQN